MRIAVVGGGSTYTPELVEGLLERQGALGLREIVLHDLNEERLQIVASFCRRMARAKGARFSVHHTTSLDEALSRAAFVVLQIRVGGQEARLRDERRGIALGLVGQETTGEGGVAKAVRTIPVVLGIARRMEALCPDAWLVNFTNPAGIVTQALLRHTRLRVVGLCNVPTDMRMEIAKALGARADEVKLDYVGLNHFGFVRKVFVRDRDVTTRVLHALKGPANIPDMDFGREFFSSFGVIPSYYLRYYLLSSDVLREQSQARHTRAEEVMSIERQLLEYYSDEANHEKPEMLKLRGGAWYSRVASRVMEGLCSPEGLVEVVNTANQGAVPGFEDDAVVEVPALISRDGVSPIPCEPLSAELLALAKLMKSYEDITIQAAVERSRRKAFVALVLNPLVRDVRKAAAVLEDLVKSGDFSPVDRYD